VKIGVMTFVTESGLGPVEVARGVEERGLDSLWIPDHSHIPVSRRSPWGGRAEAPPLPPSYWHNFEQFTTLAAAAAVTSRIELGSGITLVAQRDPIWLAKEVATLDQLSSGRFTLGVGYGWNHEEMRHHGVDATTRRRLVREKLLACQQLWTADEAEFHGEYVDFDASWAWPKPVQRPHPPIVIGGAATREHVDHIIEFADGWVPLSGRFDIAQGWQRILSAADLAGRERSTLRLGVLGPRPRVQELCDLHALGASWCALILDATNRDRALAQLDDYAALAAEFRSRDRVA
jgi:probable F420-dependent oxidoreductase